MSRAHSHACRHRAERGGQGHEDARGWCGGAREAGWRALRGAPAGRSLLRAALTRLPRSGLRYCDGIAGAGDSASSGLDERIPVRAVRAVEHAEALDDTGKAVGRAVRGVIGPGALKETLAGTWLGHALHPLLTDVVIGSLLSATLLDVLGGDADGKSAQRLIAIGIASYPPTAVTG